VNFIYFTTLFLCEIPTGAVADVFGRKTSFVISCFLLAFGMFIYAVSVNFWQFALAETIGAIGATFASGAFQAWLADKLKYHNHTASLGVIFSKEQQITGLAAIVGAISGAFLAEKNIALPWIAGGIFMFAAGVLAMLLMKEEYFVHQPFSAQNSLQSLKNTIKISAEYGSQNRIVRFIFLMGIIQFFAVQAPNMQWQPFFGQFLQNKTGFGILFAGIAVSGIIGSYLAPRLLLSVKNEKRALTFSQIGISMGIMGTVLLSSFIAAISIFMFHELCRGLFKPLKDAYLNENIPSKERATLISIESMSHHVGGMAGLLFSGFVAQNASIPTAWVLSGGILITATLLLAKDGKA